MSSLNITLDKILDEQIKIGNYKTKEEVTQELLQILIERDIDKNINISINQFKNNQWIEVTPSYRNKLRNKLTLSLNNY